MDWNGEDDEGLMMIVEEEWEVGVAIGDDHSATDEYKQKNTTSI